MLEAGVMPLYDVTIAVMEVPVMGGCIQIVVDSSFGMENCVESKK